MNVIDIDLMRRWLKARNMVKRLVIDQSTDLAFYMRHAEGVREVMSKLRGNELHFANNAERMRFELGPRVLDLSDTIDSLNVIAEKLSFELEALKKEEERTYAQAKSGQLEPTVGSRRRPARAEHARPRKPRSRAGGTGSGGIPDTEPPKPA